MAEFTCLKIRCRKATLSDKMFAKIASDGRQLERSRRAAMAIEDRQLIWGPTAVHRSCYDAVDGEAFLSAVCDWDFMMAMNKSLRSSSPAYNTSDVIDIAKEQPATVMSDNGFLPVGIVRDAIFACESIYILVRENAREETTPFLPIDLWNRLQNFLNLHEETRRRIPVVIVWVPADILKIAINHIYFQTTIFSGETETAAFSGKATLSVDVSAGDEDAIRQAKSWIREAIARHASDIHFEMAISSGRIRIRINGDLRHLAQNVSRRIMTQVITWIKAQAGMDISDSRRAQDGSLRISYTDSSSPHILDVRVSVIPVVNGQKMVLRLLNPDDLENISRLGLAGAIEDKILCRRFENALSSRDGIVLVTGPTGCGKTTTLNLSLMHLLRPDVYGDTRNIVTIEDPVEYIIPGANQTQVNEAAGMTFAGTLRALLRQDPDVMLIGEIRDSETAKIAVQAALTGHLILASLHTNDALSSVARLQDLGISPFLTASTIRIVQAQRLIHRFCRECGHCNENLIPPDKLRQMISHSPLKVFAQTLTDPSATVYRPRGCIRCTSGYSGRIAVMEMAASAPELVAAIEEKAPLRELEATARLVSGWRPMIENGIDFVCRGLTSLQAIESLCLGDILNMEED